ncbi:glyoxalase [Desulfosarcina alkanivorans]|uniref:Glyoxalase n=1 Tax=Desulfosarcina alkanivorans TaxID=571177 RepID=A0A5K7YL39_9BACT|nr:VOC family protein [Desulfosarcina alkanivorans]BBO70442.1 glyoxalase [Desulfosarcina alkanivorans]
MTPPAAMLDHLVVAADTLDQGSAFLQARLGVAPSGGGRHAAMGTHNRVLKLGRDRYIEVIAIDPDGRRPDSPRWFDLDDADRRARLKDRPRLITWVARTDALDALAEAVYGQRADVRAMQRGDLRWRFAFTMDGSLPGDGLIPHLIQWAGDRHPAESMVESGCTLVGLDGTHTDPEAFRKTIASLGLEGTLTIHPVSGPQPPGLSVRIETPAGTVILD